MEWLFNKAQPVNIPVDQFKLDGILYLPSEATGIVLFVHGSGSSRLSIRNQHVANVLNEAKLATLLFDLLTPEEEALDEHTRSFRFDIPLLATRLIAVTHWVLQQPMLKHLAMGYFGASTGGGAALVAAAQEPKHISAVVSRGGRPDLAGAALAQVNAPVLLIVGGNDERVIEMNQEAMLLMHCPKELKIIPGATHLFEEPGMLDQVASLAKEWFSKYLR